MRARLEELTALDALTAFVRTYPKFVREEPCKR